MIVLCATGTMFFFNPMRRYCKGQPRVTCDTFFAIKNIVFYLNDFKLPLSKLNAMCRNSLQVDEVDCFVSKTMTNRFRFRFRFVYWTLPDDWLFCAQKQGDTDEVTHNIYRSALVLSNRMHNIWHYGCSYSVQCTHMWYTICMNRSLWWLRILRTFHISCISWPIKCRLCSIVRSFQFWSALYENDLRWSRTVVHYVTLVCNCQRWHSTVKRQRFKTNAWVTKSTAKCRNQMRRCRLGVQKGVLEVNVNNHQEQEQGRSNVVTLNGNACYFLRRCGGVDYHTWTSELENSLLQIGR